MPTVYFALAGNTNRVKIGCSDNVLKRIRTLQTGCPDKIRVVFTIQNVHRREEKRLHKLFKSSRIHREWFNYQPHVAKFVRDRIDAAIQAREDREQEAYERKMQEEYDTKMEEEYEKRLEEEYERQCEREYEAYAQENS